MVIMPCKSVDKSNDPKHVIKPSLAGNKFSVVAT